MLYAHQILEQNQVADDAEPPSLPEIDAITDDREPLKIIEDCSDKNNANLFSLRASAYTQILWAHSLQTFDYSLLQGRMVDLWQDETRTPITLNVIKPVLDAQKALYLSRPPQRGAIAHTRDQVDVEAAQYANDAMKWAERFHHIDELAEEKADWLTKTGVAVHFVSWDPAGGRQWTLDDGTFISEGEPVWRIDSLFAWTLHPQAKSYRSSPYAHHSSYVSPDFIQDHYPDAIGKIPPGEALESDESGVVFEEALKNLSPSHGGLSAGVGHHQGDNREAFYNVQTVYFRSSVRYPNGRMIAAICRGGTPYHLLHDGENPHICHETGERVLPIVVVNHTRVPNRAYGEGPVVHMMPQQQGINGLETMILEAAERTGNAKGYYYSGSMSADQWTNSSDDLLELIPGTPPPGYISPPEIPAYIVESRQFLLQALDIQQRPIGPLSQETERGIKSGVHQMIVEETKKQLIAPLIRGWEIGWEEAWKMWIDNWRSFASVPKKIGIVGDDGGWREVFFSGALARANFSVRIEPFSAMPTSRTATFAEWIELIKSGAAPVHADPSLHRQLWHDLGKGNMVRTYQDQSLDLEKAQRNIQRIRVGEMRIAERQDNADIHLSVYMNWMKTREWEQARQKDPMLEMRMNVLVDSFVTVKQQELRAMQLQMAQMGGPRNLNAERVEGAAEGRKPGNTGGDAGFPRKTQGFGRAPNPMSDPGGNPGP